jgi:predicted phosphodiesterase
MGSSQSELIAKAETFDDDLVITGHTHLPISDPAHKFVNIGYINHGLSYYVLVENGKASFIKEQYLPERQLLAKENLLNQSKKLSASR